MEKKKKIILISIITIVLIILIAGGIYFFMNKNTTEGENISNSKIEKLYSTLEEKNAFSFTTTSTTDNNKVYYAKQDNKAYIDTTYNGEESKFLIKDGNSYLLVEDSKKYYTYINNETDLEKVTAQLNELKNTEHTEGKEKIENKEYKYEEYIGSTNFLIKSIEGIEGEAKTRFYFDGDKLVYIKTIIGTYQELLKVDISYNVENSIFEIPSDYEEA